MSGSILRTQLTRTWVNETCSVVLRWALGSPWPPVLTLQVPPSPPPNLAVRHNRSMPSPYKSALGLLKPRVLLLSSCVVVKDNVLLSAEKLGPGSDTSFSFPTESTCKLQQGLGNFFCKGPDYFRLCGPHGPYYSCSPLPRSLKEALDNVTKCGCVPIRHLQK